MRDWYNDNISRNVMNRRVVLTLYRVHWWAVTLTVICNCAGQRDRDEDNRHRVGESEEEEECFANHLSR
jgi:hypothetical protein